MNYVVHAVEREMVSYVVLAGESEGEDELRSACGGEGELRSACGGE